jgi:hypothetical protein
MNRKKPDVDFLLDILQAAVAARPDSSFLSSLLYQYQERGGLSKKQMEGLYQKALKIQGIPLARLATLEAEIRRKPTRYKSGPPPPAPLFKRDEKTGQLLQFILSRLPDHKRALFLQAKYENNELLSSAEQADLERLFKLMSK